MATDSKCKIDNSPADEMVLTHIKEQMLLAHERKLFEPVERRVSKRRARKQPSIFLRRQAE